MQELVTAGITRWRNQLNKRTTPLAPLRPGLDWTAAFATLVAFVLLFRQPFVSMVRDWWTLPEEIGRAHV